MASAGSALPPASPPDVAAPAEPVGVVGSAASARHRPGGFGPVLRNRRYLAYLAAAIAASTGYSIYAISIPWLAFQESGSLFVVGLVLFLEVGIYSLTFLVAPLVDRAHDKRTLLLVGFPVQAVAALTIAVAASRGALGLPLLLGLVAVLALFWDIEWAVFQVAPRMLLSKDELFAAGGVSSAVGGGATIGGYALGAGLILLSGAASSGFLYAALLAGAAALAVFVPLRSTAPPDRAYLAGFVAGWRYFRTPEGRPLLQLGALDAVVGFFSTAPALLVTVFADRTFPDPGFAYGFLFTAFVVGGVAVDLLLGHLNPRGKVGRVMVFGLAGAAAALALVGLTPPDLLLTALAWLLAGGALGAYSSGKITFEWGYVPADRLARVTSNLYLFPGVAGALGALVLGALTSTLAPRAAAEIAAGVLAGAVVLALALPQIRRFAY